MKSFISNIFFFDSKTKSMLLDHLKESSTLDYKSLISIIEKDNLYSASAAIILLSKHNNIRALNVLTQLLLSKSSLKRFFAAYTICNNDWMVRAVNKPILESSIIELLLHTEFIATVSGVKPYSIVKPLFIVNTKTKESLDSINNKFCGLSLKINEKSKVPSIHTYSYKSLSRLLKSNKKCSVLHSNLSYEITSSKEFDELAAKVFDDSLNIPVHNYHIVFGIIAGYPLEEVLNYSKDFINKEFKNVVLFPSFGPETFLGWISISKGSNISNSFKLFKNELANVISEYKSLSNLQLSSIEVISSLINNT